MTALSTHDTKRSEDVRARLNVLSEVPGEWQSHVQEWAGACRSFCSTIDGQIVPTADEQYLFFQALVGIWPFASEVVDDASLVERLKAYMLKAVREAKVHTSWTDNNRPHKEAIDRFIESSLDRDRNRRFFQSFLPFEARIARVGMVNSLAQTLLRLTVPGFPDTYQGTEVWDLSLVDPDNRRPVDYGRRSSMLAELEEHWQRAPAQLRSAILSRPEDRRLKLFIHWRALSIRRDHPDLFLHGQYEPITVEGERANHGLAFARTLDSGAAVMIVVPRLTANLPPSGSFGCYEWSSTALQLPAGFRCHAMKDVFSGESIGFEEQRLPLSRLLGQFPVGMWTT